MEDAIAAVVCTIASVRPGDLWPALKGSEFMWLPVTSIILADSTYEVLVIGAGHVKRIFIDPDAQVLIKRASE
jgi:hypothetical protein